MIILPFFQNTSPYLYGIREPSISNEQKKCRIFLEAEKKVYYNDTSKEQILFSTEEKYMERISKENYYLDIAETVLERATCLRRVYGAIIVKNDEIISTGYNGAPRGRRNCVDMG